MMRNQGRIIVLVVFFMGLISSVSASIGELKLRISEGTSLKENYQLIAEEFANTNAFDSSAYYYKKSLPFYTDTIEEVLAQVKLVEYYQKSQELDSCVKILNGINKRKQVLLSHERWPEILAYAGDVYADFGNYPYAIERYHELQDYHKEKDHKEIVDAISYKVSDLYFEMGAYKESEKTIRSFLSKHKGQQNTIWYIQLSKVLFHLGRYQEAIFNGDKVLSVISKEENPKYYVEAYTLFGDVFSHIVDHEKKDSLLPIVRQSDVFLKKYFSDEELDDSYLVISKSFKEVEEVSRKHGLDAFLPNSLKNKGKVLMHRKNVGQAISVLKEGYVLADTLNQTSIQIQISKLLYTLYENRNDYNNALKWLETYRDLNDEVFNRNKQKEIGKQQAKYIYDNKLFADSLRKAKKNELLNIELETKKEILQKKKRQKYIMYCFIALALVLVYFIFQRYRKSKKQQEYIEEQKQLIQVAKDEVEKKNKAIHDSITYAQNIQEASLPLDDEMNAMFPQNVIVYQPKDIISGDFYWISEVENKRYLVVADCTGHGVPGAFMTLIGMSILNEVIGDGIYDPEAILREIHSRLVERLSEDGEAVKDGMDMALTVFDGDKVLFAGAHNSVYHVRDGELTEYKGDRVYLGISEKFDIKTHTIDVQSGDMLYYASDGFPDQKGGAKSKKFFYKPFRKMLADSSELSMEEQKAHFIKIFNDWKGDYEQMDDVVVLGVRV